MILDPKINIYQIYFREDQVPTLDPAFIPFNNISPDIGSELSNKLREWPIMRTCGFDRAKRDSSDIWGFVSYKFQEKTNKTGEEFTNFIRSNPGYDVYYLEPKYKPVNPFINAWVQGEVHHPGISEIMNYLYTNSGKPIDIKNIPMRFCYYNFFAGNKKFWDTYFSIIDTLIESCKQHPGLNKIMFEMGAGHGNDLTVPYFIFVVERMFATILAFSDLKAASLVYEHEDFIWEFKGYEPL